MKETELADQIRKCVETFGCIALNRETVKSVWNTMRRPAITAWAKENDWSPIWRDDLKLGSKFVLIVNGDKKKWYIANGLRQPYRGDPSKWEHTFDRRVEGKERKRRVCKISDQNLVSS